MSTPNTTSGARRGCGYREPGGAYLAVPLSPIGKPLEAFLLDPPQLIDKAELGLSSVGIALIERDGITHVVDIVGREHYPTVAEYLEETRRLGISRRFPDNLDFSRLTPRSRLFLAHEHADIKNAASFETTLRCPCAVPEHTLPTYREMCARLWDEEPLENAEHRLAMFACFHDMLQIEVVSDPDHNTHHRTIKAASAAAIRVIEVPQ